MTWASFPGNSYGQGGRSLDWLQTTYANMLTAILAR
jgi:muramidase (phage lysozyme)